MSIIKNHWRKLAVVGAFGLLAAGQASAAVAVVATGLDNWTFTGTTQVVIPNTTTPLFSNGAGQRFIVTFSAESAVEAAAGNYSAWEDIDIVVLDTAGNVVQTLTPTAGGFDAFASSNGQGPGSYSWATHAMTGIGGQGLPSGSYRIQVRAALHNGGTTGWFGERSVVVQH